MTRTRGFTLLEVMVALSIFAVCALVLLQQSGRNARQAHLLETRTLASWIAANELAQLQLAVEFPSAGQTESEVRFARRDWIVVRDLHTTANADLLRAVIVVKAASRDNDIAYQQTGFLGRH
ncbi:MAG: type II secretion system minor pseudopilin GspI [Gammaproteobacteria bacterium]|uniref:type II secretion system minor pseudopilin GspI n=1 Tax=Pseudomaricurvus alcaniphilus TaxID=1166482 RepID=UPI001409FA6B|nr:type II secretion system minor pseudopilin GspI [Pseudomaricurvus alcaniphilus]MBR9912692.1 type II secretion system minor pseudopilin GspI [Gammaproteobacteria bacterium]NHN38930.1 type II secretion system minor pseudopilin GspI [Pseudomaricurvus alcaniphilus]